MKHAAIGNPPEEIGAERRRPIRRHRHFRSGRQTRDRQVDKCRRLQIPPLYGSSAATAHEPNDVHEKGRVLRVERREPNFLYRIWPSTLNSRPSTIAHLFRHKMLIHPHLPNRPAIALVSPNDHLHATQRLIVRRHRFALADIVGPKSRILVNLLCRGIVIIADVVQAIRPFDQ